MGRMLADIVDFLICPLCRADLRLDAAAVRCEAGHSFDVARQGYVSLLVGSKPPGTADSTAMVAARAAFLDRGHYAPLASAVAQTVRTYTASKNVPEISAASPENTDDADLKAYRGARVDAGYGAEDGVPARQPEIVDGRRAAGRAAPLIVDAGTGTGHYLAAVLDAVDDGIGMAFDVSKHAVRRAARAHPRAGAFVADVWRPLPIRSGVADVVIDVFAPRNGPEFRRVLRPGGVAVVVTPTAEHLSPLVEELGLLSVDDEKERRLARSLEGFAEAERRTIAFEMELGHDDVAQVIGMGPSAWHQDPDALDDRISSLFSRNVAKSREKVVTRAAFHLSIFEPAPRSRPVP